MDFLIAISIISFALLVSAFISASESSIIAVNKIRIKHLDQEEGNKRAAKYLNNMIISLDLFCLLEI